MTPHSQSPLGRGLQGAEDPEAQVGPVTPSLGSPDREDVLRRTERGRFP